MIFCAWLPFPTSAHVSRFCWRSSRFVHFQFRRRKKEGPSTLKIFSQKKRERRVKRDNETVFTSGGLMLSQKLGVSVLWKMGERSPQQFQNN